MTRNNLANFSWYDLTRSLRYYRDQYKEMERVQKALGIEKLEINIDFEDLKNILILRMQRDLRNLDRQVQVVNNEITRRNLLVGVI